MFKKTLSVVLSMLMVLSCMTALIVPAAAVETPTGTAIDSLDDITDLTADYYLSADIGSAEALNSITVGDAENAFTGTLDGNGKTIYTSVPVFTLLGAGAEVKNLTVRGEISVSEIGHNDWLNGGAIANAATGAFTITGCTNYVNINYTITTAHANIGGFVGLAMKSGIVVTDCVNYGNITHVTGNAKQGRVGGMIGFTDANGGTEKSVYTNCKNYGTFTDKSSYSLVGGIVGQYNGKEAYDMISCQNYGTMETSTSSGKFGGLIGVASQNAVHKYIQCINSAEIKGKLLVGGLVGQDTGACTFDNCKNTNTVSGSVTNGCSGGIVGNASAGNTHAYISCINEGAIIGLAAIGGIAGADFGAFTATACQNKGAITRFDYTTNNKDYNAIGGIIGHAAGKFTHTVIGCSNSATISGAYRVGGIIGLDLGILSMYSCENTADLSVPSTSTIASNVGGLIGEHNGAYDLYVENSKNTGNLDIKTTHGTNLLGGVIGRAEASTSRVFKNCVNEGNITNVTPAAGNKIGGIAGCIGKTDLAHSIYIGCVNTGDITSFNFVGGIAGQERFGAKLIACVNEGDMLINGTIASSSAAGMIASVSTVTMYSCVNKGTIVNAVDATKAYAYCPSGNNAFSSGAQTTAAVEFEGIQRSIKVDNETTFAVRFITSVTDIEKYMSTGVLVYASAKDSADVKYAQKDTDTVYTQIGASENGVNTVYPASPVDGKYFTALTVDDISVSGSYTFIVIPYTLELDGETIAYGDAYTVVITDGEIVSVTALVGSAN